MKIKQLSSLFVFIFISATTHINLQAETYDSSSSVFRFQKQMAKRGNTESQFKLGLMYETGSGVKPSQTLAISWYKKAARQNHKPASNRLTYLDIKKSGFNETHNEWLKQLEKDARFHEGEALFLLGQMYSEGTGVNKSLTRALKLLHKAASVNIPGSEAEIARVEHELALLQQQYISEEEKEKTPPIIVAPVKKIAPLKKTVKAKPKAIPKVTKVDTKKSRNSTLKKTSTKHVTKQSSTKTNLSVKNTTKRQATAKAISPKVQSEPEQHPMDRICGGRNRFSRSCR